MKRTRIQERKDSWISEKNIVLDQDEKYSPTANTDHKGYKTSRFFHKKRDRCHGFCKPFLLSREYSIRGHHRDGAAALNQTCVRGQVTCSQ